MTLTKFGFKEPFISQTIELLKQPSHNKYIIGRIVLEHKHSYRIITEQGEWLGTISGNYAYQAFMRKDYPAVGDWVLVEKMPGEDKCVIHKLLNRQSVFSRKMAGMELDEQIVASNIDFIFIVMSLNDDFNLRRLERYLTAAWNSGATPKIILTKTDLCEDSSFYINEVQNIALGVAIYPVSMKTNEGIDAIEKILSPNNTAALMGSSGVGKSTLTNALLQQQKMTTQSIRFDDAKGRHTTTYRELFSLPNGGVIIDTPGMRELQIWNNDDALQGSFSDIDLLSTKCKFRNCSHKNEKGCAIQQALFSGELEKSRYENFLKLQREIAYLQKKVSNDVVLLESRKAKQISKQIKNKKKNKY